MLITRAEPGHEAQILHLATRTLGWEADPRFAALYRWKHDENPVGPSPRWVALEDDRVVGFRVFLRWRFRDPDGRPVDAVRAVDTATDPDFQGRGIFRSLTLGAVEELRDEGVQVIFNTPNDQSRPGYLKMGWQELGRPRIAMSPRPTSLLRIARSRTPAELWSLPTEAGHPAPERIADPSLQALLDHCPAGAWQTDRTPTWLAWRYGLAELQYRALTTADLPGRHGPGMAVFRLRRRGRAVEATIAEVLAPDPRDRRALVRAVLRSTGADYALAAASSVVDATPSVSLSSFGPLVTWRPLDERGRPPLDAVALTIGDLELF